MNLLRAEGLTKSYGKRTVVNHVSFEVNDGEIVGILGQNGAGKSTSFSMIIGAVRPDSGRVIFQNEDITDLPIYMRARKGMGYLCQEPSVFQRLTVEENILAILETHRYNSDEKYKRLIGLLNEFNLASLAKNKAFTLSGGERRRLEIARARNGVIQDFLGGAFGNDGAFTDYIRVICNTQRLADIVVGNQEPNPLVL